MTEAIVLGVASLAVLSVGRSVRRRERRLARRAAFDEVFGSGAPARSGYPAPEPSRPQPSGPAFRDVGRLELGLGRVAGVLLLLVALAVGAALVGVVVIAVRNGGGAAVAPAVIAGVVLTPFGVTFGYLGVRLLRSSARGRPRWPEPTADPAGTSSLVSGPSSSW